MTRSEVALTMALHLFLTALSLPQEGNTVL